MEKSYEKLVKDLIMELLEYNFQQAIEEDHEIKELQQRIVELSCKVDKMLSRLDKEEKEQIEEYLNERYVLSSEYNYISYIQGLKDCLRILKMINII